MGNKQPKKAYTVSSTASSKSKALQPPKGNIQKKAHQYPVSTVEGDD